MQQYKYLFGPVPSRRYGSSLGVDLCVPKTCTLDCRFCQLGATPRTTLERTALPPIAAVLDELQAWLAQAQDVPDFITASGSGEPTLHRHFGEVFRFTRQATACRSLLLSNGTLFSLPAVRREAALADVVKLSLHAWDQASFVAITRPHAALQFTTILEGFRAFRQEYSGHLDLELFIIPGVNDRDEQVAQIAHLAASFAPDTISLNTAIRPPADSALTACPPARMQELATRFGMLYKAGKLQLRATRPLESTAVLNLLTRHPLSLVELARYFKCTPAALTAVIEPLIAQKKLRRFEQDGVTFVGGVAAR